MRYLPTVLLHRTAICYGAMLLLVSGLSLGCAASRVRDCEFHYEMEQYAKAEECCDEVLASSPGNADALFLKGQIARIHGDYESMNEHMNASLDASRKYRNSIISLRRRLWAENMQAGIKAFNSGDHAAATDAYGEAVRILPHRLQSRIQYNLARLLPDPEDQDALEFINATSLDSMDVPTLNNLAGFYASRYRYDRSIACSSQVLEIDSTNETALSRMGPTLVMTGRYEDALGVYKFLLNRGSIDSEVIAEVARVAYELGEYEEALAYYEEAIERAESDPPPRQLLFYLGLCKYELGEHADMAEIFEDLAERYPNDASIWRNLVVACIRMKDWDGEARARAILRSLE